MPPDPSFLDFYRILRDQIEHEDDLLGSRISWYVTSQSFLFGAYAILANGFQTTVISLSGGSTNPRHILLLMIPAMGIAASVLIGFGISAGVRSMRDIRRRYESLPNPYPADGPLPPIQSTRILRLMGLAAPTMLPVLFMAAWVFMLVRRLF